MLRIKIKGCSEPKGKWLGVTEWKGNREVEQVKAIEYLWPVIERMRFLIQIFSYLYRLHIGKSCLYVRTMPEQTPAMSFRPSSPKLCNVYNTIFPHTKAKADPFMIASTTSSSGTTEKQANSYRAQTASALQPFRASPLDASSTQPSTHSDWPRDISG